VDAGGQKGVRENTMESMNIMERERTLIQKGLLLVLGSLVITVESSAFAVHWLKNSSLHLLRKMVVNKLVFQCVTASGAITEEIEKYLEGVRNAIRCRSCYDNVTKPMKLYYRELKKR
jgi:hypothetical protein